MTRAEAVAITRPVSDRFLVEILETAPTAGELIEAVCRVRADDAVPGDTGTISPKVARLCAILEATDAVDRDPLEVEDLL